MLADVSGDARPDVVDGIAKRCQHRRTAGPRMRPPWAMAARMSSSSRALHSSRLYFTPFALVVDP